MFKVKKKEGLGKVSEWVTDVERYWLERAKTYPFEHLKWGVFRRRYSRKIQTTLMNVLKHLRFDSVLEVGCGYGKTIKIILRELPHVKIKAIDLSSEQIKFASKYVNDDRVEFSVGRIQDLDVSEHGYDLVMAISVLMHIPPHDIELAVKKMVEISRKHIINTDWYDPTPHVGGGGWNFAHDYTSLYKKFGVKRVRMIPILKQPVYGISFGLDSGLRIFRKKEDIQSLWHAIKHN